MFEFSSEDICVRLLNKLNITRKRFTIFLNEMRTLTAFAMITELDIINMFLCINVVDVIVVLTVVFEIVRICIPVIDIIMEFVIISDITVFIGINIVDVVKMFIIVVDMIRVCIVLIHRANLSMT